MKQMMYHLVLKINPSLIKVLIKKVIKVQNLLKTKMIECKMIKQQINKIFKNCILANQKFTEAKSQIVKIYRKCKKIKLYKKMIKTRKL